jgi:hypothetical protein
MTMNRRDLLFTGGLFLLGGKRAFAKVAAPSRSQQQAPQTRLLEALKANRLAITMTDGRPAGRGWDWLVQQARDSRFTLLGEEHGVAETAQLASALFAALRPAGYSRVAVELSPAIAQDVETAARRNGLQGILDFFALPDAWSPMHMRNEAQFMASVVSSAPKNERVLWGLDREIFSDRYLISRLEPRVPQRAREAFTRLKQASTDAWARNAQTGNPDDLFILAADPSLVSAVRAQWPNPDQTSDAIMRTLEESLAIETAERNGGMYPYMQRRTQWMKKNLAERLSEGGGRQSPKVMMKFGYNHMIRGLNYVNDFDIGTMPDEVAALSGDRAFHIIVLPGPGSRQAVLGPKRTFVSISSDEFDDFKAGDQRLTRVLSNAAATGHEVIDLRALRPLAIRGLESWNSDVVRTIHGYDAAIIWKGAHASS